MNLGDLFSGSNSGNSNNGLFGNNKTILIILVILIVIFGFGYGRGMFGLGGNSFQRYGAFQAYGYVDPSSKKKKKHHHDDEELAYGFAGYRYGATGYPGYGAPSAGYASPYGGFFGNDWWFIIAIIGLLFLLGEDTANNDNNVAGINTNVCC